VETLLARGTGFSSSMKVRLCFGLCRRLQSLGQPLRHRAAQARRGAQRSETDALDAGVPCQRLSRYVDGNRKEPRRDPRAHRGGGTRQHATGSAKRSCAPAPSSRRRARLAGDPPSAAPAHGGEARVAALEKLLPDCCRLPEVFRPVLAVLDVQIAALSVGLKRPRSKNCPPGWQA